MTALKFASCGFLLSASRKESDYPVCQVEEEDEEPGRPKGLESQGVTLSCYCNLVWQWDLSGNRCPLYPALARLGLGERDTVVEPDEIWMIFLKAATATSEAALGWEARSPATPNNWHQALLLQQEKRAREDLQFNGLRLVPCFCRATVKFSGSVKLWKTTLQPLESLPRF